MKPTTPITDASFCYTDAAHTDLRKTFERIRRAHKKALVEEEASKVRPMRTWRIG